VSAGRPQGQAHLAASLALALLGLATAAGASRLFVGHSFLLPLGAAVVSAHLLAWLCRRARLGPVASLAWSGLGVVAVAVWSTLPTAWGLPTAATLHALASEWARARSDFSLLKAPVPPTPGFLLGSMLALGSAAVAADWLAFRARARFEAILPSATLFLFVAAVGSPAGRAWSVAAWLAGVLAYLAAGEAGELGSQRWFSGPGRRAGLARSGWWAALLGAVAVAAAATLGPGLPGARSAALVDWRALGRQSGGVRTTVSPLIDIQARIEGLNRTPLFTVQAPYPSYWRLTSLDSFDGTVWSASDEVYSRCSAPSTPAPPHSVKVSETITISGLAEPWLPVAYQARCPTGPATVQYNADTASFYLPGGTQPGQVYTTQSYLPQPTEEQLADVKSVPATGAMSKYLELPASLPGAVRRIAWQAVGHNRSPYGKALALELYFRSGRFHYDLSQPAGEDQETLVRFLTVTRAGFCEQFASAYAAMARVVGLPSRIAVGFTWGKQVAPDTYQVDGASAHAWPEVYLGPSVGWVPFEPTPTRGEPGTEAWTGESPEQALAAPGSPATGTSSPSVGPGAGAAGALRPASPGGSRLNLTAGPEASPGASAAWLELVLWPLAAAGLGGALALAVRRLRRRTAPSSAGDAVLQAWLRAARALGAAGLGPRPAETFDEYACRLAPGPLDPEGGQALAELCRSARLASYSPTGVGPLEAEQAGLAARKVARSARRAVPYRARLARMTGGRRFARPRVGSPGRD
jgi:transglutaminase-like putative cysteine protease